MDYTTTSAPSLMEPFLISSFSTTTTTKPDEKVLGQACDLRIMDLDGNAVREFKGIGGYGMRCTSADNLICVTGDSNGGALVVDPATGEVLLTCPKTDVRSRDGYPYVVTRHYTTFGFCRAVSSGPYKVIRLIDDRACEILTLGGSAGWREAQPPPIIVPHDRGSPIAINGVLHFLAKEKLSDDSLLCFDLESEQWKTIEGPRKFMDAAAWKRTASVRMTELNRNLCMVLTELHLTDEPYDSIWLLTDQEKGTIHGPCTSIWLLTDPEKGIWTKAYTIPMAPSTSLYVPLRVLGDDGKLLLHCSRWSPVSRKSLPRLLQVYDPHTETCVDVREIASDLVGRIRVCSLNMDRSARV